MKITTYNTGDIVEGAMSTIAGEPFKQYKAFGISADVFESPEYYSIPLFESDNPGSGKFGDYLEKLAEELKDKPVYILNVINIKIIPYVEKVGFKVLTDEESYQLEAKELQRGYEEYLKEQEDKLKVLNLG